MVCAKFAVENGSLIMDMKGHASFAELGKDPVCAGASILAMTAAQCVRGMEAEGKLRKKAKIRICSGRVLVVCTPKQEFFSEALHLYYITETGMHLLSESYPENVTLIQFVIPDAGV